MSNKQLFVNFKFVLAGIMLWVGIVVVLGNVWAGPPHFLTVFQHRDAANEIQSLLVVAGDGDGGDDGSSNMLKPRMRDLCQTIDGFVCVVDASVLVLEDVAARRAKIKAYRKEIEQLLDSRWTKPRAPLLILACTPTPTTSSSTEERVSCVDVAQALVVGGLNRPWQVRRFSFYRYSWQGTARHRAGFRLQRRQVRERPCFRRFVHRRLEGHSGFRHATDA